MHIRLHMKMSQMSQENCGQRNERIDMKLVATLGRMFVSFANASALLIPSADELFERALRLKRAVRDHKSFLRQADKMCQAELSCCGNAETERRMQLIFLRSMIYAEQGTICDICRALKFIDEAIGIALHVSGMTDERVFRLKSCQAALTAQILGSIGYLRDELCRLEARINQVNCLDTVDPKLLGDIDESFVIRYALQAIEREEKKV